METLYIYNAANYQAHIDSNKRLKAPITQFTADTHAECEQRAKDANYDDSDLFAWSYTKF